MSLSCPRCIYPSQIPTKPSRDLAERGGSLLAEKLGINLGDFAQDLKAAFRTCGSRRVEPGVRRLCKLRRTRGAWQGRAQVWMPSECSPSEGEFTVWTWVYNLFLIVRGLKQQLCILFVFPETRRNLKELFCLYHGQHVLKATFYFIHLP